MNFEKTMLKRAKQAKKILVLPEGKEQRILKAARILLDKKLAAEVTLLGNEAEVTKNAVQAGIDLNSIKILDPLKSELRPNFSEEYYNLRKHKGITEQEAYDKIIDPLKWGAMMVRTRKVDAMVAGAITSTASVLRAAFTIIKTKPGTKFGSSFFVMRLPDSKLGINGHLIFSDCATNPNPDPEQLSEIALAAANSCRTYLDAEPIVAMLSFSSKGSSSHPLIEKVKKTVELIKQEDPRLIVDGEIQADAALVPSVARIKTPDSPLKGKANVLIFPNLEAGNIGYKLVQRLGGARAYGPFLQNFAKPMSDLSRGCSVDDIVIVAAATLAQA